MRRCARALVVLLALCAMPGLCLGVSAQTRAWLDRAQVTYGETATLNIETTASVRQIDYRPLAAQFDIGGQTVRRSYELSNGRAQSKSLFAVGIRPRGPGELTVPSLHVGNTSTSPLRLSVQPPTVQPAGGDADTFIDTTFDAAQPYVQQAVGMVVRLHYAVPLLSGQLDQDAVPGASLQRVGEDLQYQREIGGRRYDVVERRYLLIPERSGPLTVPGARFNGQAVGGFFDNVFDDGRKPLSAAAPITHLQVRPIPATAPQPWLPLHDLQLRYLQSPRSARVGEAVTVEIEAVADGASTSQLPALTIPDSAAAQVFADPPQSDERFIDGRPRTTLRRRFAIVPLKPGALSMPGPRIDWWDAREGVARTATLPPLQLQVAPGVLPATSTATREAMPAASAADAVVAPGPRGVTHPMAWLPAIAAAIVLALVVALAWRWSRARRSEAASGHAGSSAVPAVPLATALLQGDLAGIARALCDEAGMQGLDLDAVRAALDEPAQADAILHLQAARWGAGDAKTAVAELRRVFAGGARWHRPPARPASPLPPLYPEPAARVC